MGLFEKLCCGTLPTPAMGKPLAGVTNTIQLYYGGTDSKTLFGKVQYSDSTTISMLETAQGLTSKVKISPISNTILIDTAQGLRINPFPNTLRYNITTLLYEYYDNTTNTWIALSKNKYTQSFGDGTNTIFVITHNLNSQDIVYKVWDNNTNNEEVVDVQVTTVNTLKITCAVAPTVNQFKIVILK